MLKRHGNNEIISPIISKETICLIEKQSLLLHRAFKLFDYSRIDWKINNNIPYLLELTPLPQLSEVSEFGVGAARKNMTFPEILHKIVQSAIERYSFNKNVECTDFYDWKWQLENASCNYEELSKNISISNEEKVAIKQMKVPIKITPFLLGSINKDDYKCPIRRQFIPFVPQDIEDDEKKFCHDFLNEDSFMPTRGVIHRYPDRVALIATHECASYCRHCTRSREIGSRNDTDYHDAVKYIKSSPSIKDVLVTGGDPLILGDETLNQLLTRLRAIDHIDIIRIGTRTPVTLPMRITGDLVSIMKDVEPLYINIHVNHAKELSPETVRAIGLITNAGIPVGSQSVLLKGVNDDSDTLEELFRGLIKVKVKPYYLYQCDKNIGCERYYVDPQKGLELINNFQGKISGFAVPKYILDMPGSMGKVVLGPCGLISIDNIGLTLQNYQKRIEKYEI
jgi:lysine 2,3-aminomutase